MGDKGMSLDQNKWERVVSKLADDTRSGQVQWDLDRAGIVERENAAGPVYVTETLGKKIAVYPIRYKYWLDEENFEWEDDISIEFLSPDWSTQWLFPKTRARGDLLEAIQYRFSGADDFADAFLRTN